MSDPLVRLAAVRELVAELGARGQTVAAAESLTGGLLCAAIAGVPGASAVLRGGLVVYATDLKGTLAGVDVATLTGHGPVAAQTAAQMAAGARERCAATWGIGLTGVAGPDAQDGTLPGTVFVAVAGPDGSAVERLELAGDRWRVRAAAVAAAVDALRRRYLGQSGTKPGMLDVG
jgi:nicotinamide-nucleotide amidase